MMEAFLRTLLNMSLTGSLAILAVLLLRLALKSLPKIYSYALWAVVLFRLLCPVSVESDFSLLGALDVPVTESGSVNFLPQQSQDPTAGELPPVTVPPVTQSPAVTIPPVTVPPATLLPTVTVPAQTPAPAPIQQKLTPEALALAVYLLGVAAMGVYSAVSYLHLRRSLAEQTHLRENIYLADHIPTPFVMGLVRPRIYLPSGMEEKEQGYILLHEQHHIRRGDHWVKAIAFGALCIHWFNPLVWLAFMLLTRDMEMSCDEAVLQKLGAGIRAEYSQSLLRFTTALTGYAGTPLAFGEGDAKGRIKNMKNWKKPKLWLCVLAVVACLALVICLATNPRAGEKNPNFSGVQEWPKSQETMELIPGITMTRVNNSIHITGEGVDIICNPGGVAVGTVYLVDLNEDGWPEICSSTNLGMSQTSIRVFAYDYANRQQYQLYPDATYTTQYVLFPQDDTLHISYPAATIPNCLYNGKLLLRDDQLQIIDERLTGPDDMLSRLWFDMPSAEVLELTVEEYPGVVFKSDGREIWAEENGATHYIHHGGQLVKAVYLEDLNGDGKPELCISTYNGGGFKYVYDSATSSYLMMKDGDSVEYIYVYDYSSRTGYSLENHDLYQQTFFLKEDGLGVRYWPGNSIGDQKTGIPRISGNQLMLWDDKGTLLFPMQETAEYALPAGTYTSNLRWYDRDGGALLGGWYYHIDGDILTVTEPGAASTARYSNITWCWQALPWSADQWQQMCDGNRLLCRLTQGGRYQAVDSDHFFVEFGGAIWFVTLRDGKVQTVDAVDRKNQSSALVWYPRDDAQNDTYAIYLDVPCTQITVSCTGGWLKEGDQLVGSASYEPGQSICWTPFKEGQMQSGTLVLHIQDGDRHYSATIQLENDSGKYTAISQSADLRLVEDIDGEGALLRNKG